MVFHIAKETRKSHRSVYGYNNGYTVCDSSLENMQRYHHFGSFGPDVNGAVGFWALADDHVRRHIFIFLGMFVFQ